MGHLAVPGGPPSLGSKARHRPGDRALVGRGCILDVLLQRYTGSHIPSVSTEKECHSLSLCSLKHFYITSVVCDIL